MKKAITWIVIGVIGILLTACGTEPEVSNPNEEPAVSGKTTTKIINGTKDTVKVWVTLGATPGCLQDVTKIPFITEGSGLVGSFYLAPGDSTIDYAPDSLGFNGVISFEFQPDNCPDSTRYPNGINQYEFILNNAFQPGNPQESINISCVHGVNCTIRVDMFTTNPFNAGPSIPVISSFANSMDRNQLGQPGVYPYACTHCTDYIGAPACIPVPQPVSKEQICQIQRPANQSGGSIKIYYLGDAEPLK
jgi:hypothetical protein